MIARIQGPGCAALFLLLLSATPCSVQAAGPRPAAAGGGFQLFNRLRSAVNVNRVNCGVVQPGRICADSTGASVSGGGFWPATTRNQYVFSSGAELAGIIDSAAPMSWAGKPEGAFFFNLAATTNAAPLTSIWRSSEAADRAAWPDAVRVPLGDASADLFAPALQGQVSASPQDLWFLSWDGDPTLLADREHPIGVVLETRVMSYTAADRRDFFYLLYTIYNISCDGTINPGCYASVRPAIRDTLIAVSHRFQLLNNAAFAPEVLPVNGYRLRDLHFAFASDPDVTVEGSASNYAGLNAPLGLGYSYHESFTAQPSWQFDPGLYHSPFFAAAGFVGFQFLAAAGSSSPENGLGLFAGFTNGGTFSNPGSTQQLYRLLSNTLDPALGDDACYPPGMVDLTHICFLPQAAAADVRNVQGTRGFDLAPGGEASVSMAVVFAAPVGVGGCNHPDCRASIPPQFPSNSLGRFVSPDSIALGVNLVDSMSGYAGYLGDLNANGRVDPVELRTVSGSLLGKAQTALALFNTRFAQPSAPASPAFFLIPGDQKVTVLWQPSATEQSGDPYFNIAQQADTYDPNYRASDVVGYRVYRGVTDDALRMQMVAQFNYSSGQAMTFVDHTGQVPSGRINHCDPEAGIFLDCTSAGSVNGVPLIDPVTHDLGQEVLVQSIEVTPLGDSAALVTAADTAIVGHPASGLCGSQTPCLPLSAGSSVPFAYIDNTVINHRTYYYSVAAFDLNSIRSGPSSLESVRQLKTVTPEEPPPGTGSAPVFSFATVGRTPLPAHADPVLDPVSGEFNGPQAPSGEATLALGGTVVAQLFPDSSEIEFTLRRLQLGDARNGIPVIYTWHAAGPRDTVTFDLPLQQPLNGGSVTGTSPAQFLLPVDPRRASRYEISPSTRAPLLLTSRIDPYQVTNAQGRGCTDLTVTAPPGYHCGLFGPRWFDGANEHTANPNGGTGITGGNAGVVAGVRTIQWPSGMVNYGSELRILDAMLGGAVRAADLKVYWGASGKVDSVVDLTHNVLVPFDSAEAGGGWGILNVSNTSGAGSFDQRPDVVTFADLGCVAPFSTRLAVQQSVIPCSAGTPFLFDSVARPGPVALSSGAVATIQTAPAAANPGFVLYLAGMPFTIELAPGAGAPSNTAWTMRSYIGSIFQDSTGKYLFTPGHRTFSALGASVRASYLANIRYLPPPGKGATIANVHTVPDPYYALTQFANGTQPGVIRFVNLPPRCNIRIYTSAGSLVRVLQHDDLAVGSMDWDVRSRNGDRLASGVYFYSVEDSHTGERRVGRMTIVN